MMVHQGLSERAQEPKALIRDALRPEDNPLKENQRHRETIRAPEDRQVGKNTDSTKVTTGETGSEGGHLNLHPLFLKSSSNGCVPQRNEVMIRLRALAERIRFFMNSTPNIIS